VTLDRFLRECVALVSLVTMAFAQTRPEALEYFKRGLDAIRRGDFSEAESQVKAGLKIDPNSPAGYDLLGIASDGLGRHADAEKFFREALQLNPRFVPAYNDLGRSLYRRGMTKPAIQAFQDAFRLDPRNFTANFNLGLITRDQKRYAEAAKYLETARDILPSDPSTLLALTGVYLGSGRTQDAVLVSRQLVALAPNDLQVNFSLGTLFLEWKQYAEAADRLECARIAEPRNFELLHDLGQAYTHLEKYAEAESAFLNALSLRGDAVETLNQLAIVYAKWEHPDQAIQVLVRARQLAPKRPDILLLLGRQSIQEGFIDDAVEVLQDCISLDPEKIEPHLLLGEAYTRLKNYDQALGEYEIMAKLDPRNPQSYISVGRTFEYMRRYHEAEQALRKAMSIDPQNTQAGYYMGLIASDQADYAGAKLWYRQVLKVDPKHLAALYDMGVTFMRENDYAAAREYLERATVVAPTFSQLHYRLSVTYRHLKDPDKSAQAFALFKKYEQSDEQRRSYRPHGVLEFVKETQDLPEGERLQRYREALLQAEKTRPDDLNVLFMQAQIYFRLGESQQALARIAKISSLHPNNSGVRMRSASVLTEFNYYSEALEQLKTAVDLRPDADEPRFALAALYYRTLRAREALQVLSSARSGFGRSAAFHNLLGRILIVRGETARALKELGKAVDAEPNHEDYLIDLAIESAATGRAGQARQMLQEAKARSPASGRLFFAAGVCDQLSGRPADAQTAFRKAAELVFQWEAPYLAQANLLRETGMVAGSMEILDSAASLFPDSPWPHWFKALALMNDPESRSQAASEFQRSIDLAPLHPDVYPALLLGFLRDRDCPNGSKIWDRMAYLGLATDLDPSSWCANESVDLRHNRLPDEVLKNYPEWRWIVEIARRQDRR
jgi:tetratricopeptide (TPR) repeat protein